jgi:hypothetical protein
MARLFRNWLPAVEWLEPLEFRRRLAAGNVQLIDNRTLPDFGGDHMPGPGTMADVQPRPATS